MTTNFIATQTAIPADFGQGGANLSPGGGSGTPDLATVLTEHKVALAALDTQAGSGLTVFKKTLLIGEADLTAAVNGTAQTINIGTALPANARIIGCDLRALTPFTGGGASAVTLKVGTSGDIDAIVATADIFTAATDGGPATMSVGIRPNKSFLTVGAQLIATVAPDAGHQLVNLTAGSVTVDVLYTILA